MPVRGTLKRLGYLAIIAIPLALALPVHAQTSSNINTTQQAAPLASPPSGEMGTERQELREERRQIRMEHEQLEAQHDALKQQCMNAVGGNADSCREKAAALKEQKQALHARMQALHQKMSAAGIQGHDGKHMKFDQNNAAPQGGTPPVQAPAN